PEESSNGMIVATHADSTFQNSTAKEQEPLGPNHLADVISFADDLASRGKDDLARLFLGEVDARSVSDWPTYKGLAEISFRLGNFVSTRTIRYKKFSPLRDVPGDWRGYQKHIKTHSNHWKVYFPAAYKDHVGTV